MTTIEGRAGTEADRGEVHAAFAVAVRVGLKRTETSQKELAEAVGKSPVDISRYLSTPTRLPQQWPLVERILSAAGADVAAFTVEHGSYWGVDGFPAPAEPSAGFDPPSEDHETAGGENHPVAAEPHPDAPESGSELPSDRVDAYSAETGHVLDEPILATDDDASHPGAKPWVGYRDRPPRAPTSDPDRQPGPARSRATGPTASSARSRGASVAFRPSPPSPGAPFTPASATGMGRRRPPVSSSTVPVSARVPYPRPADGPVGPPRNTSSDARGEQAGGSRAGADAAPFGGIMAETISVPAAEAPSSPPRGTPAATPPESPPESPEPEDATSSEPDEPTAQPKRRRLLWTALAAAAVLLTGAAGAAVALTQSAGKPPPAAPPVAQTAGPWTAAVQNVADPGVALRSVPDRRPGSMIVARLPVGASVQVACAQLGESVAVSPGELYPTWLRTPEGLFVSAIYLRLDGPNPVPNCLAGQPPLAMPPGTVGTLAR